MKTTEEKDRLKRIKSLHKQQILKEGKNPKSYMNPDKPTPILIK